MKSRDSMEWTLVCLRSVCLEGAINHYLNINKENVFMRFKGVAGCVVADLGEAPIAVFNKKHKRGTSGEFSNRIDLSVYSKIILDFI